MVSPETVYVPQICAFGFVAATWKVPSGLIVQTVPSELVHCPVSAAGPELGTVSHPAMIAAKSTAKRIRRVCGRFMPAIVTQNHRNRQASALQRMHCK